MAAIVDKDQQNGNSPIAINPTVDYDGAPTPFSAARFVIEVCTKLKSNVFTTGTALSYFHIFYQKTSLDEYDPFMIGLTCIHLASKIADDDIRIRDIINVGMNSVKRDAPPLMLEPYFTMRDSITQCELLIMRALGFKLKIDLPHKYVLLYLKSIEDWVGRSSFQTLPISKCAWSILQDTYHSNLVINHPPELIAATCCFLAIDLYGVAVPNDTGSAPWYTVLHDDCTKDAVTQLGLEIAELYESDKSLPLVKD